MRRIAAFLMAWMSLLATARCAETLPRLAYHHPGLEVDLGVGLWAWPLPMDYDGDGDMDLVVVCPDVPFAGTYFFENPDGSKFPTFKPPQRIANAVRNVQVSYVDGQPRILVPGREYEQFRKQQLGAATDLPMTAKLPASSRIRANQWKYADLDGDKLLDLVVGRGDWADYGWDDAFDKQGKWTRGPLHGPVYWLRNTGTAEKARYDQFQPLLAGGKPIDVYGMPSPNLADFDGDGDLDLVCGEFMDGFSYFRNEGTPQSPRFAKPQRLMADGKPLRMDLQMIVPVAVDWDQDGDVDLVVGDEDGRVAFVEHTGVDANRLPVFQPPRYFRQQAEHVKFGALITPVASDWDGDGDQDLVCGNTAGYVGWIENLGGGPTPRWAAPRYLKSGGETLRVMAGPNGSIQGPCEAKWGYSTFSVADWDQDGSDDIVLNSIWGKVVWYRRSGDDPLQLEEARPVRVEWSAEQTPPKPAWNWWSPEDNALATQWRTTPLVVDWDGDTLNDLVMLDHEGYLAWYPRTLRDGQRILLPPRRIFHARGPRVFNAGGAIQGRGEGPLQLNNGVAGRSGRRKLWLADWDGDGRRDLLVNSRSIDWFRNVETTPAGNVIFEHQGPLSDHRLAGHTTSPTLVDWDGDGKPQLLIGAEDGFLYLGPRGK